MKQLKAKISPPFLHSTVSKPSTNSVRASNQAGTTNGALRITACSGMCLCLDVALSVIQRKREVVPVPSNTAADATALSTTINELAPHKNHCERGKMATPLTRNVEHSVDDIVAKHLRLWTDDPRAKSKKRGRRSRRPRHAVHFKESTLVQPIAPHDNEDKKRIWYDHEEREELKRRVRHDTKVLWRAVDLAESNGRNLSRSENFMYACLGMSSRMSPAVALKIKQNQLQHVRRMTSAQDTLTHEQLALLSSRSSQSAQERAHRIAVHYSITLA